MVTEIAEFRAQPGHGEALRQGLLRGLDVIRQAEGCTRAQLKRCVEDAELFIYEIEWETLEHHTVGFRGSPRFAEYRSHIQNLYMDPITVHHFKTDAGQPKAG